MNYAFEPIAEADFVEFEQIIVGKSLDAAINHHRKHILLLHTHHANDLFVLSTRPQVPFIFRRLHKILPQKKNRIILLARAHIYLLTLIPCCESATMMPSLYNSIFVYSLLSAVSSQSSRLLMSIIFFDIGNISARGKTKTVNGKYYTYSIIQRTKLTCQMRLLPFVIYNEPSKSYVN